MSLRGLFKSGKNDGPLNDTNKLHGIPVNILAFRTITTILSILPRSTPIEAIDNLEDQITKADYRQQVRVYDAFAHVAAGENDVAALTSSHRSPNGLPDKLGIVACTRTDNLAGETMPTMKSANLMAKLNVWNLMFSRNALQSVPESSSKTNHPEIISSSEPEDLGGRKAFDYMMDLEQHW